MAAINTAHKQGIYDEDAGENEGSVEGRLVKRNESDLACTEGEAGRVQYLNAGDALRKGVTRLEGLATPSQAGGGIGGSVAGSAGVGGYVCHGWM